MSTMLAPTRMILVGTAFLLVFSCISIGLALPSNSSTPKSLYSVKDFHNNFLNNEIYNKQDSNKGQLKLPGETIFFPWASKQVSGMSSQTGFKSTRLQKEKIMMSGPQSEESVQDLKAINSFRQRDILYDEFQVANPRSANLSNLMDVRVQGSPNIVEQHFNRIGNNDPEKSVDYAMISDGQNGIGARNSPGNYMNIDVRGITVSAVNTVEGGSATATSNIIINPIQIIESSSQASEKL